MLKTLKTCFTTNILKSGANLRRSTIQSPRGFGVTTRVPSPQRISESTAQKQEATWSISSYHSCSSHHSCQAVALGTFFFSGASPSKGFPCSSRFCRLGSCRSAACTETKRLRVSLQSTLHTALQRPKPQGIPEGSPSGTAERSAASCVKELGSEVRQFSAKQSSCSPKLLRSNQVLPTLTTPTGSPDQPLFSTHLCPLLQRSQPAKGLRQLGQLIRIP